MNSTKLRVRLVPDDDEGTSGTLTLHAKAGTR